MTSPLKVHGRVTSASQRVLVCLALMMLIACGGGGPKTVQPESNTPLNLIEIPRELGSSVHVQLWLYRSDLPVEKLTAATDCKAVTLPVELRVRPEAIGVLLSGFPGEVNAALRAIASTPGCLSSYLRSDQVRRASTLVGQLSRHLQAHKFSLGIVMASTASTQALKPTLPLLISNQTGQSSTSAPQTRPIQSRLKTYQSSGIGELRIGFPVHLPTPEALANLELLVSAVRSSDHTQQWSSVQLVPTGGRGRFMFQLVQSTPTKNVKTTLTQLIETLCFNHYSWSNGTNFLAARRKLHAQLTREADEPSAYAERLARTRLSFGEDANERWLNQLVQVSHYEWLKSVITQLNPQALMIEVGVSKAVIGTPDFELAFFEEVLAEDLRQVGQQKAPSVAATRTDILIFHKRPQARQSLRLVVGLPARSRTELTSQIKQSIKNCLQAKGTFDRTVDFKYGTLNIQSHFQPERVDDVLEEWSELLRRPCGPLNLPAPTKVSTIQDSQHGALNDLVSGNVHLAVSTGTQVLSHRNPMSGQQWWHSLIAQRPPVQFFAAGPLGSENIAPLLNAWSPWAPALGWSNLAVSKENFASGLLTDAHISLNNVHYVALKGLSPRRRVILDGVCAYLDRVNAPARCTAERSPYIAGIDVLVLRDAQPEQKGTIQQRLKRFLLTPMPNFERHVSDALRTAILKNERAINSSNLAVMWMQERLWEPGRQWLAKSLWNGLFPEESAILELSAALKSLGEETL